MNSREQATRNTILEHLSDTPRTVPDLAGLCGISTSAIYARLPEMAEAQSVKIAGSRSVHWKLSASAATRQTAHDADLSTVSIERLTEEIERRRNRWAVEAVGALDELDAEGAKSAVAGCKWGHLFTWEGP